MSSPHSAPSLWLSCLPGSHQNVESSFDTKARSGTKVLLDDWWDAVMSIPPFHQFLDGLHASGPWTSSTPYHMRVAVTHAGLAVISIFRRRTTESFNSSSLENSLPGAPLAETVLAIPQNSRRCSELALSASPVSPTFEPESVQVSTVSFTLLSEKSSEMTGTRTGLPPSRCRFAQAVRNVIKVQPVTQFTRSLSPILMPGGMRQQDTLPVPMQASEWRVPYQSCVASCLRRFLKHIRHRSATCNSWPRQGLSLLRLGMENNTWGTDDPE